jgi:DNA repair ATPase RecN
MDEEERKRLILNAENGILQLHDKMGDASKAASQSEAARERLDDARLSVINAVNDLNEVTSDQKIINREATEALGKAKKSLEDATSALMDVSVHIERIETHITEAVDEIKTTTKIVEASPARISEALSRELSQADERNEERYNETTEALKRNSDGLQSIAQVIEANRGKLFECLTNNSRDLTKISETQLSGILSLLRVTLIGAIIGTVASLIILFKGVL